MISFSLDHHRGAQLGKLMIYSYITSDGRARKCAPLKYAAPELSSFAGCLKMAAWWASLGPCIRTREYSKTT